MARYKMTVVFDVHDDEDNRLAEIYRLAQEKEKNPEKFGKPEGPLFSPTSREKWIDYMNNPPAQERRLRELEHDPLVDGSYFFRSVIDKLHEIGAFPYDDHQMPMYRTTCEITSCEKLKEE